MDRLFTIPFGGHKRIEDLQSIHWHVKIILRKKERIKKYILEGIDRRLSVGEDSE